MRKFVKILPHLAVLFVVFVWGSSFVFTKMLLNAGLTSAQIFILRFLIAYFSLLIYSFFIKNHRWFSRNAIDEFKMVALGITGGSLYFLAENTAMTYTTAINTSIIVNSCPLFTALLVGCIYRSERLNKQQAAGTMIALAGMSVVVLNGQFVLHLSPEGDILAFCACLSWAIYSLIMVKICKRYSPVFITRKVFLYGIFTIIPYFIVHPEPLQLELLLNKEVIFNLLMLGVISSTVCFLLWNWSLKKLGVVIATNYVYLNAPATILFAWWLIDEPVTRWLIIGTLILIFGLYLINKNNSTNTQ